MLSLSFWFTFVGVGVLPSSLRSCGDWTPYLVCGGYDFASNGHGRVVSSQVLPSCGPSRNNPYDFCDDGGIPWYELEHVDPAQSTQWSVIGSRGGNVRTNVDNENINIRLLFL